MPGTTISDIIQGKATCSDLLTCLFGLGSRDADVFFALVLLGEATSAQVSNEVSRSNANVYRSLEKITELGLCVKDKGPRGSYLYSVPSLEEIKDMVESKIESFISNIRYHLEGFEHRLEEAALYRSQDRKEGTR